ncbi:MAG: TRAM domain-containing protein [Clostridiales bacterium]|nr:TRAM domain-containing protein [Clostridiales bacterium]
MKSSVGARLGTALMGGLLGMALSSLVVSSKAAQAWLDQRPLLESMIDVGTVILFALIFFIFSPSINRFLGSMSKRIEQKLANMQAYDVVFGAIGLIFGLVVAYFISSLFRSMQSGSYLALSALAYIALGVFCTRTAKRRWPELPFMKKYKDDDTSFTEFINKLGMEGKSHGSVKLLDSSVLIDGRILGVMKSGFLEGEIIVPAFILDELQLLSDSADEMKRKKGKRGLDMASALSQDGENKVVCGVYEDDSDDPTDAKLLKLAKKLNASIVTNDHNLGMVASLSQVKALSLNELSEVLRPAVFEGDELLVSVVREGKEPGQGVAYMEDGTMIVIDGGKEFVNKQVGVIVTRVIRTGSGRMIFSKIA